MPTFKKLYMRKEKNSTESEGLSYFLYWVQDWVKFKFIHLPRWQAPLKCLSYLLFSYDIIRLSLWPSGERVSKVTCLEWKSTCPRLYFTWKDFFWALWVKTWNAKVAHSYGGKGMWCSCEVTYLSLKCGLGLNPRLTNMWVKFFVSPCPCSRRFISTTSFLPHLKKPTLWNSKSGNERMTWWMCDH